jgi:hypothetical protein
MFLGEAQYRRHSSGQLSPFDLAAQDRGELLVQRYR